MPMSPVLPDCIVLSLSVLLPSVFFPSVLPGVGSGRGAGVSFGIDRVSVWDASFLHVRVSTPSAVTVGLVVTVQGPQS